jgi:hypothetical protein
VWFDDIAGDGLEYLSSYVSLDGEVVASQCSGIKVRPWRINSQYPPRITSGQPQGFFIEMDLSDGTILEVNVTTLTPIFVTNPLYNRWIGSIRGAYKEKVPFTMAPLCMRSSH